MKIGSFTTENNIFLAPMAGVSDMSFRELCKRMGSGLTFTEMVSAKGLHYGGEKTESLVSISRYESPAGVQLFGNDPKVMADMAVRVSENKDVAVIDINCGCPAKKVACNGSGSALMKDLTLASRIISAVAKASRVPVTVKFRTGWDEASINAVEFAKMAEESGALALTLHGRTREQGYHGRADRDIIAEVKSKVSVPLIGNGDIFSAADALDMLEYTGCDGVMAARGAMGNPWIFREILSELEGLPYTPPSMEDRINMAIEHADLMYGQKGSRRAALEMRKHAAWYVKGLPGAKAFREELNICADFDELKTLLYEYREKIRSANKEG